MTLERRKLFKFTGATLLVSAHWIAMGLPAAAQGDYPSKPVHIVVGSSAGGSVDTVARLVGNKLTESWGKPVVVENVVGSGGNLASERVAKAKPDGYTLYLAGQALAINASLSPSDAFNPATDFVPVSRIGTIDSAVLVSPATPAKSLSELITLAKAQPGKLNYVSTGIGTPSHLGTELLKQLAGIDMFHIPYKEVGQAQTDLANNTVQVWLRLIPGGTLSDVQSGRAKAIAVSGEARSPLMPDVPTVKESGISSYVAGSYQMLIAPKGTPPEVLTRVNNEVQKILKMADVVSWAAQQGIGLDPGQGPKELKDFLPKEIEKWGAVIKAAKIPRS